jgi:GH35 family endo-1,4-beta-xylanase
MKKSKKHIRSIYLLLIFISINFISTAGIHTGRKDSVVAPIPDGPRLKDIAGSTWIGFYANSNTEYMDLVIMDREANAQQNPFYPFNAWAAPFQLIDDAVKKNDEILQHAVKMKQPIVHHMLMGPDTYMPQWYKSGSFSNAELDSMMHWYIKSIITANDNEHIVDVWNVVNESLSCKGDDWETNCKLLQLGFEDDASGLTGEDKVFSKVPVYIRKAFEYARKYTNNNLELRDYSNDGLDRGVEFGGGCGAKDDVKTKAFYQLVKHLINTNTPLDAVGFQCHLYQDVKQDFSILTNTIKKYKVLGLKVYLTEIDIRKRTSTTGELGQKEFVVELFNAALKGGVDGFFFWGVRDLHAWNGADQEALIFDDYGRAKPAYYGIQTVFKNQSKTKSMRNRQIHLDFHTSEYIPAIGEKFDKKQFQEALKLGNVNHINLFGKCCHSWSYYPTKVGKMHPNLEFDLLGAKIEACQEISVKCPIYYIVGWSNNDAKNNPEWCARKKDGSFIGLNYDFLANDSTKRPFYSWWTLCWLPGGPYHQHIMEQVEELCQRYPLDGFWFDMYHILPRCYCQYCLVRYKKEGININDNAAIEKSMALASKQHMKELRNLISQYHPDATVFFNATPHLKNTEVFKEKLYEQNTQQELEDLPTMWGGYDKLPIEAKYHLGQGSRVTAMSGKFHKDWGEFGGFKHPDALKYEASAMISFGASCNFGDQLHPSGEMNMDTYRNIGEAYRYVEQIEEYGPGGIPASKLGIWLTLKSEADLGVVYMLLEMHYDFVIADEDKLDALELVIIPSCATLSEDQARKISDWVKNGGKLILFGEGALNIEKSKFIIDVGAKFLEPSPFSFDYTVLSAVIGKDLVKSPFLNYEAALRIEPTDAKVLARIREPYFNRTYKYYSSHRETPYKLEDAENPAVIKKENVIYFAHPLDQLYFKNAVRIHRDLVKNAIDLLYEKPILKVGNLPSCGRVSLLKQEQRQRYIAHLLYAPALQRGDVMVLEDFLPVSGVEIEVDVPEKVKKVYQIPDGKELAFTHDGNRIKISIPTFTMHTGIVINY